MAKKEKTTDELVLEMLKTVQRKKDEIAELKKQRPAWKTNCSLGFGALLKRKGIDVAHDRINIQVVTDSDLSLHFGQTMESVELDPGEENLVPVAILNHCGAPAKP